MMQKKNFFCFWCRFRMVELDQLLRQARDRHWHEETELKRAFCAGYLLPEDKVGQGTYQDELMFTESGTLELVITTISDFVLGWAEESGLLAAEQQAEAEEELAEVVARLWAAAAAAESSSGLFRDGSN
jgi:hypothetical protein